MRLIKSSNLETITPLPFCFSLSLSLFLSTQCRTYTNTCTKSCINTRLIEAMVWLVVLRISAIHPYQYTHTLPPPCALLLIRTGPWVIKNNDKFFSTDNGDIQVYHNYFSALHTLSIYIGLEKTDEPTIIAETKNTLTLIISNV